MSARAMAVVVVVIAAGLVAVALFWDRTPEPPATHGSAPAEGERPPVEQPTPAAGPATRLAPPIPIEARPFQEGEGAPPEPPPVTGTLVVTVVGADGKPIAGAGVAPCAMDEDYFGGSQTQPVLTGADGTARVGISDRTTHVVVTAKGYPPVAPKIENRERMRVVLGGDVTLRGKVVVDGKAPPAPLTLTARGYADPTDSWPQHPRNIVRRQGFGDMSIPFATDAKGEFAVRGFLPGATAMIQIPEGYRFARGFRAASTNEAQVICNGEPVAIELEALKAITGRVVTAVGDLKLEKNPDLHIFFTLARPGDTPRTGNVQAKMGTPFAIYFSEPALDGVDLQIWSAYGTLLGRKAVRERFAESKDLGEIVVDVQTRHVKFKVNDHAGRPIEGARIFSTGFVSGKTDASGTTGATLQPSTRAVVAGAPRFKITSFTLPDPTPDVVELRLERSVTLVVRVRHEDPSVPTTGLRVALSFDVSEAVVPSTLHSGFDDVRGAVPVSGGGSSTRQTKSYAVDPREDLAVSGFSAGEVVEVRVEDVYQHVLLRESITLAEADTHPIEMIVRSTPQTVRGVILDHSGRPLSGAQVGIVGFWKAPWSPRTDESGRFEIPDVYADDPVVETTAPGHVPKKTPVEKRGEPLTIQLERARQLAVTLTGGAAGPFQGVVTFETSAGESIAAGSRGERLFWFEAIPHRPGVVRVTTGNKTGSSPVGADETSVSVPVPE